MKYLGIDYGTKKVGIAISDESGGFAFPKAIVSVSEAIQTVDELCKTESISTIVVGESVASNGERNVVADAAKKFAEKLHAQTNLPVVFEQEFNSSVEAHRYQTDAGSRDDSAAAIILQRFLDKKKK